MVRILKWFTMYLQDRYYFIKNILVEEHVIFIGILDVPMEVRT